MTKRPQPSDRRVQTVCLLILTLIAVPVALALLKPVLVPFVLALFFSQCLTPFIDLLMRRFRLPQMVAVTVAALAAAALVTGVGFLLASSIAGMSQRQSFDQYQLRFDQYTQDFLASRPAGWLGIKAGATSESIMNLMRGSLGDVFGFIYTQVMAILTNTTTVLILMAFLLFGRRRSLEQRTGILAEIEARVQRYISLTVAISIATGLMVGLSLGILGVPFAAVYGFLAFLLNFIPNLGAVVATVLPLPLVFLDPHLSIVVKLLAILIPTLVQTGIGFLQPRMMGNSLELHPVVLLLSLLFFAMIWNVAGAFLATPLTAVIKIVFEKIPATRPLAALLAGDLKPLTESIDPPPREPEPQGEARPPTAWDDEKALSAADDYR